MLAAVSPAAPTRLVRIRAGRARPVVLAAVSPAAPTPLVRTRAGRAHPRAIRAAPTPAIPTRAARLRAATTAAVTAAAATAGTRAARAGLVRHVHPAGGAGAGHQATHGSPGRARPARASPGPASPGPAPRPTTGRCRRCHRCRPVPPGTANGTTRPRTARRATTREMLTGEERDREPGHLARGAGRGRRRGRGAGRLEAHPDVRRGRTAAAAAQRAGQHRGPRLRGPGPGRGAGLPGRPHRGPRNGNGPRGRQPDRHQHRRPAGQRYPARGPDGDHGARHHGGRCTARPRPPRRPASPWSPFPRPGAWWYRRAGRWPGAWPPSRSCPAARSPRTATARVPTSGSSARVPSPSRTSSFT